MARKVFESNGIQVEYESNVEMVLEALQIAVERGLEVVGERAEAYAKEKAPRQTGNLIEHITHEVDGDDVYVGCEFMDPPYGIYVELGTGIYYPGGGRPTPWVYKGKDGHFYQTNGQPPHPFIKPAAADHGKEYHDLLEESLENA